MTRPPLEQVIADHFEQHPSGHWTLTGDADEVVAALRAQAEAEARYRLMVAAWVAAEDRLRELDERGTHADWEAGNERLSAAEAAMYAAFSPDQARAALAQADAADGAGGAGAGGAG
ncbi:hypothetical protein GCM10008959_26050 [Deinococcus seoulensis]|uniref:Transcriptional regulator n=1 Tax=Deinococcus seoulensis TaxID=1837379 RepID=A0ABQ2RUB0_9DEIO|nr:hypothetical protein [Deinococcus seoulensis]GGR62794.1 hypothetical protein GCM10008959_26050 [Deinococcus seoulensis]